MPPKWTEKTDESDYDLIALTLDRMEAAAGAGQYRQAEQARLEAYAFFEFGPGAAAALASTRGSRWISRA